eukprot:3935248-Rhodomonas_salina.1
MIVVGESKAGLASTFSPAIFGNFDCSIRTKRREFELAPKLSLYQYNTVLPVQLAGQVQIGYDSCPPALPDSVSLSCWWHEDSRGLPEQSRRMAGSKKRITLHSLEREGERITALCGSTLEETKQIVGAKLGFATPSACRLFNKHGAEIDHLDLVMHDDLLYASAGGDFPQVSKNPKSSSRLHSAGKSSQDVGGTVSTLAPFGASTIEDMDSQNQSKGDYFEIGKVLGTGGQGTTYLAKDKRTNQQTVLKQIFCAGLSETNKAIEEAMMLSRLKHHRVVTYNEVFLGSDPTKGNYVGIVMEYCSGGDLYQMLCRQRTKRKPVSVRRVKMWTVQMCEALKYLHSQRVIHRDVKPMNVLLDSSGDLKIADFGLARHGVTPSKLAKTQCGTPGYESPEVQMGQGYDFKTDIWGLGCVLCDMTTL